MPSPRAPSPQRSSTDAIMSLEASLRRKIIALQESAPSDPRLQLAQLLSSSSASGFGRGASPVLRAMRDAVRVQLAACDDDDILCHVALAALDAFVTVRVHGARAKTSAFFDKLSRERYWDSFAIFAGSTVAEEAFLAINIRKQLTVIDVAPKYEGRGVAKRLAAATGAAVRYGLLGSCRRLLEGVDAVIIGAEEVAMNGCVLASPGAGIVVQIARELGVSVVVTTQAVKFSEGMIVDWTYAGYDVIRPHEILTIVTEMNTSAYGASDAPDVLKVLAQV